MRYPDHSPRNPARRCLVVLVVLAVATLAAPAAQAEFCCEEGTGLPPFFPVAPFPMIAGEGAATCFAGCAIEGSPGALTFQEIIDPDFGGRLLIPDPDGFVLSVVDLWDRGLPPTRLPPASLLGENWCAPMFHGIPTMEWTTRNLGQVFGLALDAGAMPDIYATATTSYGDFLFPPTSGGPGAVYRISPSGAICVYADLPQGPPRGGGLGNVAFDALHQQIFVSNFTDGLIYRLAVGLACGADPVIDTFDHGVDGRGSAEATVGGPLPTIPNVAGRFTERGRRVWGLGVFEDRLYYSVWWEDMGNPNGSEYNEIWSVGLLPDGSFDTTTVGRLPRREILVPPFPGRIWSMPVSDISFSTTGRMMLTERGMAQDTGVLHDAARDQPCADHAETSHFARGLEYRRGAGGAWVPSTSIGVEFNIGEVFGRHTNAAGGADYTCDGDVWFTADLGLNPPPVYGLVLIDENGNTPATVESASWHVDLNGYMPTTSVCDRDDPTDPRTNFSFRDKGAVGDIELLDCPCPEPTPPVIVCKDCEVCNDPGRCDAMVDCPSIATAVDPNGDDLDVTCEPVGPYPAGETTAVVVTASDGTFTRSLTCYVTVRDCEPPVCEPPEPITVDCNQRCGVTVDHPDIQQFLMEATGSDNCTDVTVDNFAPEFFRSDCPPGHVTTVGFVVRDENGYEDTCVSEVTVRDVDPPMLMVPDPLILECDESGGISPDDPRILLWLASATATDACSDVTVEHDPVPPIPTSCAPGTPIVINFRAFDECGNADQGSSTITVLDTHAPRILCVPEDAVVACDAVPPAEDPIVEDECDDAPTLMFNEEIRPGRCPQEFMIIRTWTATDFCGNQTVVTQTIEVVDVVPPRILCVPPDVTVQCDDIPPPVDPVVEDNCDDDPMLTFNEDRQPGSCPDEFTIIRTWTATDACGNTATEMQTIQVIDDTPPRILCVPPDVTVQCDDIPPPVDPVVEDNCDDDPMLVFTEDREPGSCPDEFTIIRTWTATDDCGNTATEMQTIRVIDDTPPRLLCVPPDVTVECPAEPPRVDPMVEDNCDPAPVLMFREVREDGDCPNNYVLRRLWIATDRCGNSAEAMQVVTVRDTTGPLVLACGLRVAPPACPEPPESPMSPTSMVMARSGMVTLADLDAAERSSEGGFLNRLFGSIHSRSLAPALEPSPPDSPMSPMSPMSPGSPTSPRSNGCLTVVVDCGIVTDNCTPSADIDVMATLVVINSEIVDGECTTVVTELPVECGEELDLLRVAPPCPAEPPASPMSPGSASSPTSEGPPDDCIGGQAFILVVTATDECGNVGTCSASATTFDGALGCPPTSSCPEEPCSPTLPCGFFEGPCPPGLTCFDDPTDGCNPACGPEECPGDCVFVPQPPIACGGPAAIPCPGDLTCADDPEDTCHPDCGDVDCEGICVQELF